jgi:hypothetical protein
MSYTDTDGTEYTPFYTTSGQAIGIYGSKNSTINNTGRILINGADSDKRYGIYSNGGTVLNSGTIIVGAACSGEDCFDTELYPNAIVLNGGILLQNGTLEVTNTDSDSPASLNLNNFDGMVVASDTSKFVADGAVSGTINMSSSVVGSGFAEEYRVSDMISATDISALNLQSQSLLFDVKLENGKDAVLTMKSFADVTENASMAEFLQQNYAAQNNESLFNILKSQQTLNTFNETVDTLSGNKVFDKFMFEDLNAWRELSFNMSQNMLQTDEKTFSIVGSSAPLSLGNEKTQNSYAISGVNRGDYSYGMGMALADMHSGKSAGNNAHHDRQFQLAMPLGYRTHGFKLLTTPRFGFAYGTYEREGYNGTNYDGTVEKRLFGINNEVRYPLKMASWTVAPTLEFNLLGYHLKGHETAKQYSINIKSQDNYSMETGMGIYANRELVPSKDAKLKLSGGVGVYHEFANPYDIELQMNGMSGSWTLHDENRSRERAVVRTGLDYDYQDFSLYGHISSYIDNQYRTNVDLGIKYKF